MITLSVREQIEHKLDSLNPEQLAELLRYIEVMESSVLPEDYDEDNDPTVGFFSASPDYARRSKEVLRAEFGLKKKHNKTDESA
jgi:hypothetical protein